MRKRYIVTTLTALAIVAYMTLDDQQELDVVLSDTLSDQEPDYIIEGLNAESYDEQGMLTQKISADKALHYPQDDITVLENPAVLLHENNQPKWGVKSDSGRLLKNETIELDGNVIIEPLQDNGNEFSLTTASLNIDLIKQIADTDDAVLIESDNSQLNAQGMTVILDKQQVNFKSQVRGRHDPKTN